MCSFDIHPATHVCIERTAETMLQSFIKPSSSPPHPLQKGAAMIWKEVLAAGGGCAIADSLLNPLEVMKVKLQLLPPSPPTGGSPPYYSGMISGLSKCVAEDGLVSGLYVPGLVATNIRAFTYTGFRIGLYPTVRNTLSSNTDASAPIPLTTKLGAGAITGAISAAIFCPVDVVRVRMQAQSGTVNATTGLLKTGLNAGQPRRYPSTLGAFPQILREEGAAAGLWRGSLPTVIRAAGLSGSQLASYETLKTVVKDAMGWKEGPVLHLSCSLASGLIAQTVIQPVDTIRSVVMVPSATAASTASPWSPVVQGLKSSGGGLAGSLRFLYRGYVVACCRQGPIMLIQMPLVEQLRLQMGLDHF